MEMILGVIEDILERYESGSPEDKAEAEHELKSNFAQFQTNLQGLAGNADAQAILARLEKTNLG